MSAPNAARGIIFQPGRLIADPSDWDDDDYGGTVLGSVRMVVWRPSIKTSFYDGQEFGGARTDIAFMGHVPVLNATLRGWDSDALSRIYPGASTGTSGRQKITVNGTADGGAQRIGALIGYGGLANGFKLLFAPDAKEMGWFLLLYHALPIVEERAEVRFAQDEETSLAVAFHGTPDSTSARRMFAQGFRQDMPASFS